MNLNGRVNRLERRPAAPRVHVEDMSELERYNRILAILAEVPAEVAHRCQVSGKTVAQWREHVERKVQDEESKRQS